MKNNQSRIIRRNDKDRRHHSATVLAPDKRSGKDRRNGKNRRKSP